MTVTTTLPQTIDLALATTGGEFNALPIIIGAIVLVVLGGVALLLVRMRAGKGDDTAASAVAAGEPSSHDEGDSAADADTR